MRGAVLLAGALALVGSSAWAQPQVFFDPSPITVQRGDQFDLSFQVGACADSIASFQLYMSFDPAIVNLVSATEGALYANSPHMTWFIAEEVEDGFWHFFDTVFGSGTYVLPPGELLHLRFEALQYGYTQAHVDTIRMTDIRRNALPVAGFQHGDIYIQPMLTNVFIENVTLTHTDDYIKNGDAAKLTATVVNNDPLFSINNIRASLTGLGGGSSVAPDTYADHVATWQTMLGSVTTSPANGQVTVTVTATDSGGGSETQSDNIVADNTPPTAVTAFDASPGHQKCLLSWTNGTDTHLDGVVVRRQGNAEYPTYPLFVANWPDVTAYYPATATSGVQAYVGTGTSATDAVVPRDIHYYQAFCYDIARNYGPAAATARDLSTNYWLGDVAAGWGTWGQNGLVNDNDLNNLGGTYYVNSPGAPDEECDVGPTVHPDYGRVGLPKPDDFVGFEDLMIFSMNYAVVAPRVMPLLPGPAEGALTLSLAEVTRVADEVEVALRLNGNTGVVKGLSAAVRYDPTELAFVSARATTEMQTPAAQVFFWSGSVDGKALVDLAVLGTGVTIGGSGDIAVLTFCAVAGEYALGFDHALLRGADNEPLDAILVGLETSPEPVTAYRLVQNVPNPFNPKTAVVYEVPQACWTAVRVYDITGRLVRTLVDGTVEPGRHTATWDGRNDAGECVGSGVYFCTMETPEYHATHKMVLMK